MRGNTNFFNLSRSFCAWMCIKSHCCHVAKDCHDLCFGASQKILSPRTYHILIIFPLRNQVLQIYNVLILRN